MKRLRRDESHDDRNGVILLLVLVALIIAATSLVAVARESHRLGTDAIRAKRDLQQKWGAESLRRSLLPVATVVFEERDKALRKLELEKQPPAELLGELALGDTRFQFVLADENARANVNSIYHYSDKETATKTIRELSNAISGVRLNPECKPVGGDMMITEIPNRKRPVIDGSDEDEDAPAVQADHAPIAFRSWGQVFDLNRIAQLQTSTRRLSCWSTEATNIRRADDETVVELVGIVIGKAAARRMVNDYRKNRVNEIGRTIKRYAAEPKARSQLNRLLSESSVCYSLWVRSVRMSEVRDSFAVLAPSRDGAVRTTEVEFRGRP